MSEEILSDLELSQVARWLPRLVRVTRKKTRHEKDREHARAAWLAAASPALAATGRQLDPGERHRIWRCLLERGMVDWAVVLEPTPEDEPAPPRRGLRRRRRARPASAY